MAAAGFVDATGARVMFAPHLPWRGEDVRDRLAQRIGAPVLLENDATCAAHAEATYGAGQGAGSMLLVTLGTGIGGALVLDGRTWRGASGMAGEFGHMQVVPDGDPCECGQRGCWEQYCSGNALVRDARARLGTEPTVLAELLRRRPDPAHRPDGHRRRCRRRPRRPRPRSPGSVTGSASAWPTSSPPSTPRSWWSAGGVSDAGDKLLDPARDALARHLVGGGHRTTPPLVRASLGPHAGLVGAAALARAAYC